MKKEGGRGTLAAHFEALKDADRRRLLVTLRDPPIETPAGIAELLPDADEQLLASMRHLHVPKLESMGYVDGEGDQIRRGPRFAELESLLATLEEQGGLSGSTQS